MFDAATMLYLYAETPLHAGVGSGLSAVDLPIQRERTTQYPLIQGSGIKGKLRAVAEQHQLKNLFAIFGPDTDNASDHASALVVGDARILLFPVRSLAGVFAYVTSADVLNRFKRDFERDGKHSVWSVDIPDIKQIKEQIGLSPEAPELALITPGSHAAMEGSVVLEEFSYTGREHEDLKTIADWIADNALPPGYDYWQQKVRQSLVLLPEDDFRDFAINATEIITRIRIKRETKTVDGGALWTEEHLPTDTLLYAPVYATATRNKEGEKLSAQQVVDAVQKMEDEYVQLGGDETVGRGIVRISWQNNGRATP